MPRLRSYPGAASKVAVAATPPSKTSSAEMVTPSFFLPDSVTSSSSTMPVTGRERELMVPAPSVPVVSGEIC